MPTDPLWTIEWTNVYQIVWKQTLFSQLIINRAFYQALGTFPGGLSDIAVAFEADWGSYMLPFQSDELTLTNVVVTEMWDERNTYDKPVSGGEGQDNGACLPAFFGYRFRLVPERTRVRKGRKIVAGVCEQAVDQNSLNSAYSARIASATSFLQATRTIIDVDFAPVLLSPANTKHTADIVSFVVSAEYMGFSTQGSRKLGRGA